MNRPDSLPALLASLSDLVGGTLGNDFGTTDSSRVTKKESDNSPTESESAPLRFEEFPLAIARVTAQAGNTSGYFCAHSWIIGSIGSATCGNTSELPLLQTLPPPISLPKMNVTPGTGRDLRTPTATLPVSTLDFSSIWWSGTMVEPISKPRTRTLVPIFDSPERGRTPCKMNEREAPVSRRMRTGVRCCPPGSDTKPSLRKGS